MLSIYFIIYELKKFVLIFLYIIFDSLRRCAVDALLTSATQTATTIGTDNLQSFPAREWKWNLQMEQCTWRTSSLCSWLRGTLERPIGVTGSQEHTCLRKWGDLKTTRKGFSAIYESRTRDIFLPLWIFYLIKRKSFAYNVLLLY